MLLSEDVCITGIAGYFPKCGNVSELMESFFTKKDLLEDVPRIWKVMSPNIPPRNGKLPNLDKFDSGFFGIHHHQASAMDPGSRKLLEISIAATMDAGINPESLRGSNTGVFIATSTYHESEESALHHHLLSPHFGFTGCTRSMYAQNISYYLDLKGPSVSVDTGCAAALTALEHAFRAIKSGKCDNAIVGGANTILNYNVTTAFLDFGILDAEGKAKVFDEMANGTVRAEAVSVILLQRQSAARRIYAKVRNIKMNCDGFNKEGMGIPSAIDQELLMRETYEESKISPNEINFVEAHATGTRVGLYHEILAIENVFCTNRKTPLYVGSVKSNMGHSETASGLNSILKVIFCMQNNCILPNINITAVPKDIKSFATGKMRVATDVIKDDSKYFAVQNYGFGGVNTHTILERCTEYTIQNFRDENRLIFVSGRTKKSCEKLLQSVRANSGNNGYLSLLTGLFQGDIKGYMYRGYILLQREKVQQESIKFFAGSKLEVCLILTEPSYRWINIFNQLVKICSVGAIIQRIQKEIALLNGKAVTQHSKISTLNKQELFFWSTISQIATIEVLNLLEIPISSVIGISCGVISCAFACQKLTMSEAVAITHQTCFDYQWNIPENKIKLCKYLKETIQHKLVLLQNLGEKSGFIRVETKVSNNTLDKIFPKHYVFVSIDTFSAPTDRIVIIRERFLSLIGELYLAGLNPKLEKIYPQDSWPIQAPFISPLLEWNYNENWNTHEHKPNLKYWAKNFCVSLCHKEWKFLNGHKIDGNILFPPTVYLSFVWECFLLHSGLLLQESKIIFENVKFLQSKIISQQEFEITVQLCKMSKRFEVRDGDTLLATGKIRTPSEEEILDNYPFTSGCQAVLQKDDIYKKLKLTGYRYEDEFCSLKKLSFDGLHALQNWNGNWVTYLNGVFQFMILKEDSPQLCASAAIEHLMIDAPLHYSQVQSPSNNGGLDIFSRKYCNFARSSSVEAKNLQIVPIYLEENHRKPLLESYKFIPLTFELPFKLAVEVTVQLIVENLQRDNVKVTEITDEHFKDETSLLSPYIYETLLNQPKIQAQFTVFAKTSFSHTYISVENKSVKQLSSDTNVVIVSNILQNSTVLEHILRNLPEDGFILSREFTKSNNWNCPSVCGFQILSTYQTENESLVLLGKNSNISKAKIIYLNSSDSGMSWISKLQKSIENRKKIFLVSENDSESGILGFVNCLKCEIDPKLISCFFLMDKDRKFEIDHNFYNNQIRKGLFINVLKNGEWGTYRLLPWKLKTNAKCEHFIGTFNKQNRSEFQWIEGPLFKYMDLPFGQKLVEVHNVGLDFEDIAESSNRFKMQPTNMHFDQNYCIGREFSGIEIGGRSVMGIVRNAALSNLVVSDTFMTWDVPSGWSMEDAATVPKAYCTVLYALIEVGRLKHGQSILIHASDCGMGLSAIHVAQHYQCKIFTTANSASTRQFLKNCFPFLKDSHIGFLRDSSFEQLVMKETKGKGVDVIINSLSDNQLASSLRCLAKTGKFLELGKKDVYNSNSMSLNLLSNRSFCVIHINNIMDNVQKKVVIASLVSKGIQCGYVQPLSRTVYDKNQIVQAMDNMYKGLHVGKVVIITKTDQLSTPEIIPRFYCRSNSAYVIIGGLGGIGLEFSDWLITRGVKKLIIVSRSGITSSYQSYKLHKWDNLGVKVTLVQKDLSLIQECDALLRDILQFNNIEGIFNLTLVTSDALFENQTVEAFQAVLKPKAKITSNLDIVSRELCPTLRHFVVFSSAVCTRSKSGLTNYAMANSVIERICENRKQDGFSGLAIQLGTVGDAGFTADMDVKKLITGTVHQKISSCLEVIDKFLMQEEPILSTIVIAEKTTEKVTNDVVTAVTNLIGINKDHVSLYVTLSEIGMTSILIVELKQLLEKQFQIFMTLRELRQATLNDLKNREIGSSND